MRTHASPVVDPGPLVLNYLPTTPHDPLSPVCPFCRLQLTDLRNTETNIDTMDAYAGGHLVLRVAICLRCGWHSAVELKKEWASGLITYTLRGISASLQELDVADVAVPVEAVKQYLLPRYDERFDVHPRVFERVVASVFRDLGYHTVVTGYTHDGGIDIILEKNGQRIGVQVKRYRGKITVDPIRSLTGALVVHGLTRGVFVTTSEFTRDASALRRKLALRGYRVHFVDAGRFYAALGIASRRWRREDFDVDSLVRRLTLLIQREAPAVDSELFNVVYEPSYSSIYDDLPRGRGA